MASNKSKASELLPAAPNKKARTASLEPPKSGIPTSAVAVPRGGWAAKYPWDSHQDDIVVNSVELDHGQRRIGVNHYRHQLSQQQDYKHICVDIDEYRNNGVKAEDLPNLDDDKEEKESLRDSTPEPDIDYTEAPDPPASRSEYEQSIYKATTHNPAIFLAILRVAQKNLPFINFDSAISHLPNMAPADPLPKLAKDTFPEDCEHEKLEVDLEMTVAFLPHFYSDARHALGYYALAPDASKHSRNWVETCFFTPCTSKDLDTYCLVEYLTAQRDGGIDGMKAIGARNGQWCHTNVVEDWEDWSSVYNIVRSIWQTRLGLTLGGEEDPRSREN